MTQCSGVYSGRSAYIWVSGHYALSCICSTLLLLWGNNQSNTQVDRCESAVINLYGKTRPTVDIHCKEVCQLQPQSKTWLRPISVILAALHIIFKHRNCMYFVACVIHLISWFITKPRRLCNDLINVYASKVLIMLLQQRKKPILYGSPWTPSWEISPQITLHINLPIAEIVQSLCYQSLSDSQSFAIQVSTLEGIPTVPVF